MCGVAVGYVGSKSFVLANQTVDKNGRILLIEAIVDDVTEAAPSGVLCKKVFLEISQNSEENACARVSFLIKLQATLLKKKLWHRCFPVNFAKYLRTPILTEHLRWLLLLLDFP